MNKKISAFVTSIAMLFSSAVAVIPATTTCAESFNKVDLSNTKFFPEVIHQGNENSCVACATTYYQFTYEARRAVNNQNPDADIDFTYSPASVYPLINNGGDYGSQVYKAYNALKNRGALTMDEMPYDGRFDLRFYTINAIGKRQYTYKDEYGKEHPYTEPLGISYILDGDKEYKDIVSGSTVKNADGEKIIDENEYEFVKMVGDYKQYRRKGEYISEERYKELNENERDKFLPVYKSPYCNDKTGEYWHETKTYRAIPKDEEALFNALNVRLYNYEGCSIYPPDKAKRLISEDGDLDWDTEDQKERENKFIEKIKEALDNGHVVAASTSNFNFDMSYGGTYRGNENCWVVFQNVKKNNEDNIMGHEFTIVGYDDSIKCDIDGDGYTYSPGEQGAFKIANSAGTGWGNNGFVWVMYDALRIESANKGCADPALIYTQDSDGTRHYNNYRRHPAIEDAYIINVSLKDVKLVSEVNVRSEDYYSLSVNNSCNYARPITNFLWIDSDYYKSVIFQGPIYTDITNLCASEANGKDYTIMLSNNSDKKTFVKSICLKDDKGTVVSERSFIDDDVYTKGLTNYKFIEETLSVNFEKGDLDYDHDYDSDDYQMIKEYFDILSEDIDEYEKNIKIREKFSNFQIELLDANNDGNVDEADRVCFPKQY